VLELIDTTPLLAITASGALPMKLEAVVIDTGPLVAATLPPSEFEVKMRSPAVLENESDAWAVSVSDCTMAAQSLVAVIVSAPEPEMVKPAPDVL